MKRSHLLTLFAVLALLLCCILPTKAEAATEGYYTYTVSGGNATITDCSTSISGNITIPSTLGGYPVTAIGNYAFSGCSSLTAITIPNSVTSIGDSAFSGCSSLESMTIPFVGGSKKTSSDTYQYPFGYIFGTSSYTGGVATLQKFYRHSNDQTPSTTYYIPGSLKSVTVTGGEILGGAFYNCSSLTSITLTEGVTGIGSKAFYNCSSLTDITIPDSVTSVGSSAFEDCSSLTAITIPDSVTSIGNYAFQYCSSLTSVTIGNSVTSIGNYAFSECSSLTAITIPGSVTSIGHEAFQYCSSLTSVTIGNSVTSIGNYAFYGCSSLNHVAYAGTQAQWAKISRGYGNTSLTNASKFHYETTFEVMETCVEYSVYCPACQCFITQTLKPNDAHIWQAATCTEPKTCTVCSATEGDALGHKAVVDAAVAPACGKTGLTEGSHCSVCNAVLVAQETVPALEHSYEAVTTEPTCELSGTIVYTCRHDSSHTYTETIPALGHKAVVDAAVAPVCGKTGLTEGSHCSVCNAVLVAQETVPALEHSYEAVTTEPTCELSGTIVYTCRHDSGHTYTETIPALGHSGDLWFKILAPTCTTDGINARICTRCNATELQAVAALGHSYSVVVTAPTCTENGYTTKICSVCQDVTVTDHVEATGHAYSVLTVQPTCTEQGYTTKTCATCGDSVTEYVPAKGHGWSDWIQISAASCTAEGARTRFCNCGVMESTPIPKKPHSYNKKEICTVCGDVARYDWTLSEDTVVDRTLTKDLYIDLNGFALSGTIVTNGYKIYGKDSTTDSYTCDEIGSFSCVDKNGNPIVPVQIYTEGEKQYLAISREGSYSFHRFFVGVTHMSLAPETVGLGYKTAVYGDEMVFAALAESKAFTFQVQLEGYNPVYRRFDRDELTSGATIALRIRNYDVENYSEHNLYAQVSLTLKDGTVIETQQVALTFRWMAEQVEKNLADYTEAQLDQFREMLRKFPVTETWGLLHLLGGAAEINGNQYASLEEAAAVVKEKEIILLKKDAAVAFVQLPAGAALDLNGYTVSGTVLGKLILNGGDLITAEGYKMIGANADYYKTENAVVTIGATEITIESGTVTLAQSWWTATGQTLTIGKNATFVIPTGIQMNVNGATVVVEGSVVNHGAIRLMNGAVAKGTILGKLILENGDLITAEGYKMIGANADYYKTENAVVTIGATEITIESGTVTLAQSWWTAAGQTLTIGKNATFVIPAGLNLNVNGSAVIIEGTAIVDGSVTLYSKDATVRAAAGLHVVGYRNNTVLYVDGVYCVAS